MSDRKALVVWGGWDGHDPEAVGAHFANLLEQENFDVQVSNTLDAFKDNDLTKLNLIVPVWTMGEISQEQREPVTEAVAVHGVGLAGCHGGMCDAFRADTEWQFMTGGQWVAHPGDTKVEYTVNLKRDTPLTADIADFRIKSEQYYLHTDPGNTVHGSCSFPTDGFPGLHSDNPCQMPQIWTKMYGRGRVYYNALGHDRAVFDIAEVTELMRRGFLWASK